MKKILIAYFSAGGHTQRMAEFIAEGIRFSGNEAAIKRISDIKTVADVAGYDGYIFGSPTFFLDTAEPMKTFLFLLDKCEMEGKLAGSFGPYTHDVSYQHDSHAPGSIFNKMQDEYKMEPFQLGPLALQEPMIDTREGIKACQDYGKVFGEKLSSK